VLSKNRAASVKLHSFDHGTYVVKATENFSHHAASYYIEEVVRLASSASLPQKHFSIFQTKEDGAVHLASFKSGGDYPTQLPQTVDDAVNWVRKYYLAVAIGNFLKGGQ